MNSFLDNRPNLSRKDTVSTTTMGTEPGFQPLFSAVTAPSPRSEGFPVSDSREEAAPQVELVQSGGKVERIIVTCTCCNRIELQCQY